MDAPSWTPGAGIGVNAPTIPTDKAFPILDESFAPRIDRGISSLSYDDPGDSSDDDDDDDGEGGGCELYHFADDADHVLAAANPLSTREKLHNLKTGTKRALKTSLTTGRASNTSPTSSTTQKNGLLHAAAPLVKTATSALVHPRTKLKGKLAGTVANHISELVDNPTVSREQDAAFIEAHDKRDSAVDADDARGVEYAKCDILKLQNERRNMRLRLIMGKQVNTVRCVHAQRRKCPEIKDFPVKDADGNVVRDNLGVAQIDWVQFAGDFLLFISQDFTAHYIEEWQGPEPMNPNRLRINLTRIFVESGPWQQWLVHIRCVYRWDDPYETFRWLCLYSVLWYTSHLIGFIYGYIVVSTLWRFFFPSISDIKEDHQRAMDRTTEAVRFNQLIDKNGTDSWLATLAEDLGPWAQLQLGDIASLLEIMNNFYHWTSPRTTLHTVIAFSCCLLVTLIGDMDLCVRIIMLVIGILFFFTFPVSSRYPKYRYLVSPLKWLLWNIPTHVEWAFSELRLAAQNKREEFICARFDDPTLDPDSDSDSDSDSSASFVDAEESDQVPALADADELAEYRCRCGGKRGSLVICASGLRFKPGTGAVMWSREWRELGDMKKRKKGELEITWESGEGVRMSGLGKRRDQVFCSVLGYSGMKWQWTG